MLRLSRAVALVLCVSAQLMRFHCRIPQHYLVLLSLSGFVVFAASACVQTLLGLAVLVVLCALRESRRFCGSAYLLIGATRALLRVLVELQIGALCNLQLCHHQSESPL